MNDVIIFCAKYLAYIVALICVIYWLTLNRRLKIQLAIAVILAVVVAFVLGKIAGKIYYHPRPFVVEHIKPLVSHSADNGFPSDHATFSMMLATLIYFYRKKLSYFLFALALIVGWGRVAAHVHWTIDVLAGFVFGIIAGLIGYWLAVRVEPKGNHPSKSRRNSALPGA